MSRIDELIAIAEGTGTASPIQRPNIDELIAIAESKSVQTPTPQPQGIVGKAMGVMNKLPEIIRPQIVNPDARRTALEVGGSALAGAVGGPAFPLTAPLGYAMSKKAADMIDVITGDRTMEQLPKSVYADYFINRLPGNTPIERGTFGGEARQSLRDILEAALADQASRAAVNTAGYGVHAGKWVWKKGKGFIDFVRDHLPIKAKGEVERVAAEELKPIIENIRNEDLYNKMYKESAKLQKEIPAAKYTLGQMSGEPNAIALEARLSRGIVPGAERELAQQQRARGLLAGHDYIKQQIPELVEETGENIDDVIRLAEQKRAALGHKAKVTEESFSSLRDKYLPEGERGTYLSTAGQKQYEKAKYLKGESSKKATELYNAVPDMPLKTEQALHDMLDLEKTFKSSGYEEKHFPNSIYRSFLNKISSVTDDGERIARDINFQELRGIRSDVKKIVRNTNDDITKHYLSKLSNSSENGIIDNLLNQVGDTDPGARQAYDEANKYYRNVHVKKFKQGRIAEILKTTSTGDLRHDYSAIPLKFTENVDAAAEYTRVFGKGNKEMSDSMMTSFLNAAENPVTHEVNYKSAMRWYSKHLKSGVLDELGLKDQFQGLIRNKGAVETALQDLDKFNKSILAKVLKADPEHAIEVVMSGHTKNTGQAMKSILQDLKVGDKATEEVARKGLKRSFVEFLFKKSQKELSSAAAEEFGLSPITMLQKRRSLMQQYNGALNELFKDEPHKLVALRKYQLNAEILARNTRLVGSAGGSETAELLGGKLLNIAYQGFGAKVKALRIFSKHFLDKHAKEVNMVVQQGLYDPETAFTLVDKHMKPEVFKRRMIGHIRDVQKANILRTTITQGTLGRASQVKAELDLNKP